MIINCRSDGTSIISREVRKIEAANIVILPVDVKERIRNRITDYGKLKTTLDLRKVKERRQGEAYQENILTELGAAWREHGIREQAIIKTHVIIRAAGIETVTSYDLPSILAQPGCGLESGVLLWDITKYCRTNGAEEPSKTRTEIILDGSSIIRKLLRGNNMSAESGAVH
jgi:hypothetical protein